MAAALATPQGATPTSAFIGRDDALDGLRTLVESGARLISLVGTRGVGKSRLAARLLELDRDRLARRGIDAVVCDLAGAVDLDDLLERISRGLDVDLPPRPTEQVAGLLAELLHRRGPFLLVLDGVDRSVHNVRSLIDRWHTLAPRTSFLVTTRAPLGAEEEILVEIGPLRVPPSSLADAGAVLSFEAVQLFVERARMAVDGYVLVEEEARAAAEIVRRLDGLPLAIEIAAARVSTFSPTELLERLPSRMELLAKAPSAATPRPARREKGKRGAPSSQRDPLTSTLDWSWRLLKPWEQVALAQSAVFRGGFTQDAAAHVIDLRAHPEAPSLDAVLDSLQQKSLLRVQRSSRDDVAPRFSHHDSVRELAERRLHRGEGYQATCERHTAYYVRHGLELLRGVDAHGGLAQRRHLEQETENLLAVVRTSLGHDPLTREHLARALECMLALEPVLSTRGPFSVHLSLLDAALESTGNVAVPAELHARALESRGRLLRARGQLERSRMDLQKALLLAERAGDHLLEGRILANVGTHHMLVGEHDEAERTYARALDRLQGEDARPVIARALTFFGQLKQRQGCPDAARVHYLRALSALREAGDVRYEGITLADMASLLLEAGELEEAAVTFERALSLHRDIGNRRFEGAALRELGTVRLEQKRTAEARELLEGAIDLLREVFDCAGEARAWTRLGDTSVDEGRLHEARAQYEHAAALAPTSDHNRRALLLARCAALEALAGAAMSARASLSEARQLVSQDDVTVRESLLLFADLVDAALGAADAEDAEDHTLPDLPRRPRCKPATSLGAELRAASRVAHQLRARL